MNADDVLARLRSTGPGSFAERLAQLAVRDALARPVRELVDPKVVAQAARDLIVAVTSSDAAATEVTRRATQLTSELAKETRAVGEIAPKALRDGARALAEVPATPSHDVVMRLLDRDPLKRVLRAQIVDTLVAFGRRAASPVADNAIARGIGGFSKLVAKGATASGTGALGRMASAVSSEMEKQVEKRATDFADTALAGVLEGIAEQVSDPSRAKEQAAIRAALVDGLFDLTGADLAALARGHEAARVAAARTALAAWVASPTFASDVEAAVAKLIEPDLARPLRDVVGDFAMLEPVERHAVAVAGDAISRLFAGEAFAAWMRDLLTP
jgi:hypothetical protein